MAIVNVITLKSGIIEEVKSFSLGIGNETISTISKKAEGYFIEKVNEFNPEFTFEDAENCDFDYDEGNGVEVVIVWSV